MTAGTLYILLVIINRFINTLEKGMVAAGVILLLLSFAYGIHDMTRGKRYKTMTEPRQEYIDELRENLRQEEEICGDCRDKGIAEICETCSVNGNINDLEKQIAAELE